MKKNIFLIFILMQLFACAVLKPRVRTLIGEPKTRTLIYDNSKKGLKEEVILSKIVEDIFGLTNYPKFHCYRQVDNKFEKTDYYLGVKVVKDANFFTIRYLNGYVDMDWDKEKYEFEEVAVMQDANYAIKYRLENKEDKIVVKLISPMVLERSNPTPGLSVLFSNRNLDSDENLIIDGDIVFNSINSEVFGEKIVKGEIDSQFNDESVFANYVRILSFRDNFSKDILIKRGTFKIEGTEVNIQIYPYRNRSKVLYDFIYKYKVTPDGKSYYDENEIKKVVDEIKRIAND